MDGIRVFDFQLHLNSAIGFPSWHTSRKDTLSDESAMICLLLDDNCSRFSSGVWMMCTTIRSKKDDHAYHEWVRFGLTLLRVISSPCTDSFSNEVGPTLAYSPSCTQDGQNEEKRFTIVKDLQLGSAFGFLNIWHIRAFGFFVFESASQLCRRSMVA